MEKKLLIFFFFYALVQNQCCVKTAKGGKKCLSCPTDMHLFKGNCIFNVDNCLQYSDGFACSKCSIGYKINKKGECYKPNNKGVKNQKVEFQQQLSAMVLADYGKSKYTELRQAKEIGAIRRTYQNGTKHYVIYYQHKTIYYELIGEFNKENPFIFAVLSMVKLNKKPNLNFQNPTEPTEPIEPVEPQEPPSKKEPKEEPADSPLIQLSLSYKYLNFEERKRDKEYLKVDNFIRQFNSGYLDKGTVVLAVYVRLSGLKKEYKIFYSGEESYVYEADALYDLIRKRVYILSFGDAYARK